MEGLIFYPTDVNYETNVRGKLAIQLFGKTSDGKKICVIDPNYDYYFYVVPEKKEDINYLINKINSLKIQFRDRVGYVLKTELVNMNYMDKPIELIKVYVNPDDLRDIKKEIKEIKPVKDILGGDLNVYKQYLIDKDILPLVKCKVEGEIIERSDLGVEYVVKADRIEQDGSEVLENPKIFGLDIEIYAPEKSYPTEDKHPIIMLGLYGKNFKKVITWKHVNFKDALIVESEEALLRKFEEIIEEENPDYIVGYFSDGLDLPYIHARAKKNKLRLRIGAGLALRKRGNTIIAKIRGIVHIDILKFIKNTMTPSLKLDSYSLDNVAKELLNDSKLDIDIDSIGVVWDGGGKELIKYCEYNLHDAKLAYDLCIKLLPVLDELVKLTGQPLFDVSRMGYSQLVESYLMKRAKEFKEVYPNKPGYSDVAWRRSQTYEGASVIEPSPGLYENIVVLDFKGFWPSIIISKNISPGTLVKEKTDAFESPEIIEQGEKVRHYFTHKKEGFIPLVIKDIIVRRNRIKELIKKEDKKNPFLKARSYCLKTIANATYGYFGFFGARWYSKECASSITAWGREYIKDVIEKALKKDFEVVYSDTDSIFLKYKNKKDAFEFLNEINEELPSLMELELEDFYPRGIFVMKKGEEKGAKKKYALVDEQGNIKVVGFEAIRRDWSFIAKEAQKKVLNIILKENSVDKALKYIRNLIENIKEEKIEKEKMIIQTQLKKSVDNYDLVGPHVVVARKMQENGDYVGPGSIINYIVVKGKGRIREKAKLPDEAENYDPDYYINNQIMPAVDKIFEAVGYVGEEIINGKKQRSLSDF